MTDIERISTWMICTWNHHTRVITQNQETVAMTSTSESKRVFKSQTALKWRWTNVHCNVCFYVIWRIYRYVFLLNTQSGVKSCLVAPGVAVPPWATETVLSPCLVADETETRTRFHTLYDENSFEKKKNTYYSEFYVSIFKSDKTDCMKLRVVSIFFYLLNQFIGVILWGFPYTVIMHILRLIIGHVGMMVTVFANRLGDWGQVIPKTQKWYLMLLCLSVKGTDQE